MGNKRGRRLAKETDRRRAAHAIALAVGRPVRRVVLISRATPFPRPAWMSVEVYRRTVRDGLRDSLRDSSWADLWFNFEGRPEHELRIAFTRSIQDILGISIGDEKERIRRLAPIIQLLEHAIPLGEKADEPGVWLVLVA
ncbi:hypothetical protein AMJ57_00795 [Parcubacteria bacterium SG8_24]|nr:MAG: hypothetical protein AMJ57_00795 [Parcubacteria bacterium SG8_24]